jgi:hypothetical protein
VIDTRPLRDSEVFPKTVWGFVEEAPKPLANAIDREARLYAEVLDGER